MLKEILNSLPDTEAFHRLKDVVNLPPVTSIRLNPLKSAPDWLKDAEPVPWCENGRILASRPDFTRDPAFHQGRYYVQEAASMFIYHAVKALASSLRDEPLHVLDACAAPGGKTTAVFDALKAAGKEIADFTANEFDPRRAAALYENITRHGSGKIRITIAPAQDFAAFRDRYDLIIADAPCSGEGMIRKEPVAVTQWSPELVSECAARQLDITRALFTALRPGGIMIYSTCTFNRRENEEILSALIDVGAESITIPDVNPKWNIQPGIDTPYNCYRFIPGTTLGEGLFMAAVRKPRDFIAPEEVCQARIPKELNSFPSEKILPDYPSQADILRADFDPGEFAMVELTRDQAVEYLRGNALHLSAPRGPVILTYQHLPLAVGKSIGTRINNLYPGQLRIRSTY